MALIVILIGCSQYHRLSHLHKIEAIHIQLYNCRQIVTTKGSKFVAPYWLATLIIWHSVKAPYPLVRWARSVLTFIQVFKGHLRSRIRGLAWVLVRHKTDSPLLWSEIYLKVPLAKNWQFWQHKTFPKFGIVRHEGSF